MAKLYIYPYASGSESAKLLSERLNALRIRLQNSSYTRKAGDVILNWGNSNCPYNGEYVINQPAAIKQTVDKLRFFRLMVQRGLSGYLPQYWTNREDIPDGVFPVFCRTTTTGMDGDGIVIATKRAELVNASLYTAFVKDSTEYRVTMFKGEVTDIQTKRPRVGENANPMIRTYKNGWGFQRLAVPATIEAKIKAAANAAIEAAGLDFAGVDVLYDMTAGRAIVLEVNTAMGLEGDALERFAKAVEKYVGLQEPEPAPAPVPAVQEDELVKAVQEKNWVKVISIAAGRL